MYNFNKNFYSDVRIEDVYTTNIEYTNKEFESYKLREQKRAFIRVYDGKVWLYTSTTELDKIQQELDKLYAQAIPNEDIENNNIVKKFQVNVDKVMLFENNSLRKITKQQKIDLVKSYFVCLDLPEIKYSAIRYIDRANKYEFYSSKGANIQYDRQYCGIAIRYALVDGEDHYNDGEQIAGNNFEAIIGCQELFNNSLKEAINYMHNAVPCQKGDFPIIMSPSVAGVFAHESFGHKSEADFMLGDETMRKEWAIGTKVGSDILSIVDYGAEPDSGYVPYDDEGTKTSKTYLIKNGVLQGRLHSATTADYLNEELTGNARAKDCTFEPIVRMTSTYVEAGNQTFDELVSDIKFGYYIKDYKHGSGMSQFTIAPSICYEIVDGKLGRPAKISVITGSVFETLSLIDGLSDRVELDQKITGGCGKMEQWPLPVNFGGPYVRISKISVQ